MSKSSIASSLMLANLLLITIFGSTVAINCTLYFLPSTFLVLPEQDWQFGLSMEELVSILVFMLSDIFLALALLSIRDFTSVYYGCSSTLTPLKVNCGSSYIPISLCFKWMLQDGKVFGSSLYYGVTLCVLLVLAIVQLASLLHTEYQLLLPIYHFSSGKQSSSLEEGMGTHAEHLPIGLLFIALKSCLMFWMVIDLFAVQPEAMPLFSKWKWCSPMMLDYPLLLSVLNFVFVFFAHQPIEVFYRIRQTKSTALTQEALCCDGSVCSSTFHSRKLVAYKSLDQLLHPSIFRVADVELEVQSEYNLPEWLRLQIFENIYSNSF